MEKDVLTEFKGSPDPKKITIGDVMLVVLYEDGRVARYKRKW